MLSHEEIGKFYRTVHTRIANEARTANSNGKRLVIFCAEDHQDNASLFANLCVLNAAQGQQIKDTFLEWPQDRIDEAVKPDFIFQPHMGVQDRLAHMLAKIGQKPLTLSPDSEFYFPDEYTASQKCDYATLQFRRIINENLDLPALGINELVIPPIGVFGQECPIGLRNDTNRFISDETRRLVHKTGEKAHREALILQREYRDGRMAAHIKNHKAPCVAIAGYSHFNGMVKEFAADPSIHCLPVISISPESFRKLIQHNFALAQKPQNTLTFEEFSFPKTLRLSDMQRIIRDASQKYNLPLTKLTGKAFQMDGL